MRNIGGKQGKTAWKARILLKLTARIINETSVVRETTTVKEAGDQSFRDTLEECFVLSCRKLDVPVPLWLRKNTREFTIYRRTAFTPDQFVEKVNFDRLEIKLEQ